MGYPKSGIRKNSLANDYVSISLKAYSEMKGWYETLKVQEANLDSIFDYNLIYQKRIIATVFAHMAIESFINNYAAACLGDNEFYDNFDKLSIDGKLQLITKFILNDRLKGNSGIYTNFKTLKRQRNAFIHNKSYLVDELETNRFSVKDNKYHLSDEERLEKLYKNLLEKVDEDIKEVRNAIKVLIDIANYFDSHDENMAATLTLFGYFGIPEIIKADLGTMGLNYNEI